MAVWDMGVKETVLREKIVWKSAEVQFKLQMFEIYGSERKSCKIVNSL